MHVSPIVEYATPATDAKSVRLLSLDVFRGFVILSMLVVNNIGDANSTGYFWKHADWAPMSWGQAWRVWWGYQNQSPEWQRRAELLNEYIRSPEHVFEFRDIQSEQLSNVGALDFALRAGPKAEPLVREFRHRLWEDDQKFILYRARAEELNVARSPMSRIPLFTRCTLADYVMPWFMLIIGVAIPFSVAASLARGAGKPRMLLRSLRRAAMLLALGWILCYFRDRFGVQLYRGGPWRFKLGMDVLQLLGISYLAARVLYECSAKRRAAIAALLFVGHWALLRFYPQGDIPRGAFDQHFDAIGYIYVQWRTLDVGPATFDPHGLLSIIPATATMLIGTFIGDLLRDETELRKVAKLMRAGVLMCLIGFLWAFDLPFNKPRWTPSYLLWTSGVGTILLALLYWIIDVKQHRRWTYPLVVFGTNAIALYFCSILFKVLLLNTPRVQGRPVIDVVLGGMKQALGPWLGGWAFTIAFIALWWVILDQMYRRRIFWKL